MYKIDDINYMVSLYCPGKCLNCNIWKYDKKTITKNEIDLSIFENIFKSNIIKDTHYFDLTGGESQLSPKYIEAVKIISKYKPNAFIHTNISGWYPKIHYEVVKECLNYVNRKNFRIDVSLDGRKENYEKIRLVKNGFEKVLETISLLKSLGIILRVVMIIYKENYEDIEWIKEFAQENKIEYYIGYARNSNLLNNKNKKFSFTKKELEKIEKKLNKIEWLNKKRVSNWLWAKSIYMDNIPKFECLMGKRALVIDPYGDVYPCNERLDFLHMGNLKDFDGDIEKLLYSNKAIEIIKKIENYECQPCDMLCAHKIKFPWGVQSGLVE